MGALRAAELAPYGMIGSGVVWQWYEDKKIEGDDEVSLLHGYAEQDYCHLSEPLVNMRFTLDEAVKKGLIDARECLALVAEMKERYFAERSYEALGKSETFVRLPKVRAQALTAYLETHAVDIKMRDAEDTLRAYAAGKFPFLSDTPRRLIPRNNATRTDELFARGYLTKNGQTMTVRHAFSKVTRDPGLADRLLLSAIRQFYLCRWLEDNAASPPKQELKVVGDEAIAEHLTASAMTLAEFQEQSQMRASTQWLLSQDHGTFGIDGETQRIFVETCSKKKLPRPFLRIHDDLYMDTAALPYIVDWAANNGIICPEDATQRYLDHCYALSEEYRAPEYDKALRQQALIVWMSERAPAYFGYTNWSGELAIVRELQWSGTLVA
jgi:hypothetical protein